MGGRRDPNFTTGHLCRFCGQLVPWGTILRIIRVDPDTPPYMLQESACHTDCLRRLLRPEVELTFHRHWDGKPVLSEVEGMPFPDDSGDVHGQPCAICARDIAAPALVRLRVQRPAGTVKKPEFDEQTLALHGECLAEVSTSRFG